MQKDSTTRQPGGMSELHAQIEESAAPAEPGQGDYDDPVSIRGIDTAAIATFSTNSEPFHLKDAWYAMYDGRISPSFVCQGAAAAWLAVCRRNRGYRT